MPNKSTKSAPQSENPEVVPRYHEFCNPLLLAMHQLGGSASLIELDNAAINVMALSPQITEIPHGDTGRTEVQYRLAWARTYLKKYGLITNGSRGIWTLTTQGQNTTTVDIKAMRRAVQAERHLITPDGTRTSDAPILLTPEDEETIQEPNWREQVRVALLTMTPAGFERLCQNILRQKEFIQVQVTGRTGDGGIDGHGIVRLAGVLSFPIIFQAKRYRGSVGAPEVRNFRGAMVGRAEKALFITTGNFTPAAAAEATRDGAPPIDLIDGEMLIDMLKDLKLGVTTKQVEVTIVDQQYFADL